jgi:S-adenosylmethionine hydrolase
VIAFLTDFGTRDHYAGTMKGVVLSICPEAAIVDITHEVPPQDVLTGALELAAACRYFPDDTVFVAVVDPGVGSSRRGMAAEAGGYRFVAPDNGLLTAVFDAAPPSRVVELAEPRFALQSVSRTFEGRDRFAPAGAWLARGIDLAQLGPPLTDWRRVTIPRPHVSETTVTGTIVRIDHFGNLITNIDRDTFDVFAAGRGAGVDAGGRMMRLVQTYAEAPAHAPCALFGSTGHLEIAVNGGSAEQRLGLTRGAPVVITRQA